ncbi:hypothetical protein FNH05_31650 [Amycolatopsis rhizosphaerae]|uniref:DUF1795 domain-containing protein n=1 Tax=Amycolatopsis rhizosphaerae TaxID=2053003 RepID=A0A558APU1_9PSEU|nr:hypothetical protein FNH05_31650 [Amycolatopsis rhizosphaerae]
MPEDWTRFTGSASGDGLPPSTLVEWVSPDGSQMFAVDHIAGYSADHDIEQYIKALSASRGTGNFRALDKSPLVGKEGWALSYRTLDRGGNTQISRTTFAQIFRQGNGLWAVSVTVPTEQEETAKAELYQRIMPTFSINP